MIGKMMSEAAHSIIGMFSARPVNMESKASNLDFGSLLQSSENPFRSVADAGEMKLPAAEKPDLDNPDTAAVENLTADMVTPIISQNMQLAVWSRSGLSENAEASLADDKTIAFAAAGTADGHTVPAGLPNHGKADGPAVSTLLGQMGLGRAEAARISAGAEKPVELLRHEERQGSALESRLQGKTTENANIADGEEGPELARISTGAAQSLDSVLRGERQASAFASHFQDRDLYNGTSRNGDGLERAGMSTVEARPVGSLLQEETKASEYGSRLPSNTPDSSLLSGKGSDGAEGIDKGSSPRAFSASSYEMARPVAAPISVLAAKADGQTGFQEEVGASEPFLTRPLETFANQTTIATLSVHPVPREQVQAGAPFDLTAPRLAERLAAEISDMSASGETKKFEINPRNLGRMEITFATRGSTEIVEIQTENRFAKDVIAQHSHLLQDMLKSQGRDDLSFRVDVKDNMLASARADSGQLGQQDNRGGREQQSAPAQSGPKLPVLESGRERMPVSDDGRYA